MSKILAAFLDGTWNSKAAVRVQAEALARGDRGAMDVADTNVGKLFDACTLPISQKRYFSGVGGLRNQPAERLARAIWAAESKTLPIDAIHGGAFGKGIARQIRQAYSFLSSNYQPGDRIFLFGFSRGAFAARSLAGFADRVGLLFAGKEDFIDAAFLLYQMSYAGRESSLKGFLREVTGTANPRVTPDEEPALPIYFIGVWDTVASLGLPSRFWLDVATRPFNAYHRVDLPSNVTHARHALALHELRGAFRPVLWHRKSGNHQSLVQALFRGAHADVGGGYLDPHWSDYGLRWMHGEASANGLPTNPAVIPPPNARLPPIHCESRGLWRVAGTRCRIPEFEACPEPLVIHPSALDRGFQYEQELGRKPKRELDGVQTWLGQALRRQGWQMLAA
jgi:hypothetical protein